MSSTDRVARCKLCPWCSVSLPESTAKMVFAYHVVADHPAVYTSVTSEATVLSGMQQFELLVFTERDPARQLSAE